MRVNNFFSLLMALLVWYSFSLMGTGCAQIGSPTGGPKDTTPPRLLKATPALYSTEFRGNKITLLFDEYVNLQDVQSNFLVSPLPKNNPLVDYKLKTVTVKLKDSLLPNTTYTLNFGNAIRDNNENNPLRDFTYVFSTGKNIDSLGLTGQVIIAETGRADSTLFALLYRNLDDSAVKKTKPDYMAKLNKEGNFIFSHLSPGRYKVYALKDVDGGKTYNSKSEIFAFADQSVTVSQNSTPVRLSAFAEEKAIRKITEQVSLKNQNAIKKLLYSPSNALQNQDLNDNFELLFNKPLKKFDPEEMTLTDTSYKTVIPFKSTIDSTRKKVSLMVKWQEDQFYRLILNPSAFADSSGNSILKRDTIHFKTKKEIEYGNLVLRFSNIDLSLHPVLQFVQADEVKESYALTAKEWSKKLFKPGEYELRILYDSNNNGKWDTGNYGKKIQPEKVFSLPEKISIRANWDNERDIKL